MTDSTLPTATPDLPALAEMPFTMTGVESAPIAYIDGISQVALGYPVSKVFLHQVIPPTAIAEVAQKEVRKVSQILMIPTVQLVEACKNILGLAKAVEGQFGQMNEAQAAHLASLLADVEPRKTAAVKLEEQTH